MAVHRNAFTSACVALAALASASSLLACAGPAGSDAAGTPPRDVRVIVRFKPGAGDPSDAGFRARLAEGARVGRIELIRPMSGDAWVMRIACDDAPCDEALRRVAASPSVDTIERDGRERHQ